MREHLRYRFVVNARLSDRAIYLAAAKQTGADVSFSRTPARRDAYLAATHGSIWTRDLDLTDFWKAVDAIRAEREGCLAKDSAT